VNKNNLLFYTSDYSDNEDEYKTSVGNKKKYPKLNLIKMSILKEEGQMKPMSSRCK
jgi:hypothetical protein